MSSLFVVLYWFEGMMFARLFAPSVFERFNSEHPALEHPAPELANSRRLGSRTRGFSMIELATVVGIIGILAAIAIPTFQTQRQGAQDRAAQTSIRNAVTQARASAIAGEFAYPGSNSEELADILNNNEPALEFFSASPSESFTHVSVNWRSSQVAVFAARSDTGKCWIALDDLSWGTYYGFAEGECDAGLAFDSWILDSDGDPSNGYDGLTRGLEGSDSLATG